MAYITLANAKRIIYQTDIKSLSLTGEIYKIPIRFFSKYEEASLLAIQELLKDPERFFREIYIPFHSIDTLTYVYEGVSPCYHWVSSCLRLHSDFVNYEIPEEIRAKGKEVITLFRQWFHSVKHLLETPEVFAMRLEFRWGIKTNPKAIKSGNSGITLIDNYDIKELESKIDKLIKDSGRFYYESVRNTTILKRFSQFTFLAYKSDPIANNNTGYTDDDVKQFLGQYDKQYKRPLKEYLINYYKIKLNPELKLEGSLLENIGFKPCPHCHNDFGYRNKWSQDQGMSQV